MKNTKTSLYRINLFAQAALLAVSLLLPVVLMQDRAGAATIQNRFIDMSSVQSSGSDSSNGSGRNGDDAFGQNVTYTVGFDMPITDDVGAIVVEFCENADGGPITLQTCTAPAGLDVNTGTAVAEQNGITGFSKITDGVVDAANRFGVSIASGSEINILSNIDTTRFANSDVKFDITGITNPSASNETFYARIIVYSDSANLPATSWVPTATGDNGVGTYTHDGGVALATASHLTVSARVQEVLQFCIGTQVGSSIGPATGDDCLDLGGTDLDLGVVDSGNIQRTSDTDIDPIGAPSGNNGLAMIRTNAIDGAAIYYKAEQESGITDGAGTLRQTGIDDCGTIANVNNACFNSAGGESPDPTKVTINTGIELFGMTLRNRITTTGGNTDVLTCDINYNGDGSCGPGAATQYAWDPSGEFDTLATSTGPIDDELVEVEFAATASPTTPTGAYTVTANFVATSQF